MHALFYILILFISVVHSDRKIYDEDIRHIKAHENIPLINEKQPNFIHQIDAEEVKLNDLLNEEFDEADARQLVIATNHFVSSFAYLYFMKHFRVEITLWH